MFIVAICNAYHHFHYSIAMDGHQQRVDRWLFASLPFIHLLPKHSPSTSFPTARYLPSLVFLNPYFFPSMALFALQASTIASMGLPYQAATCLSFVVPISFHTPSLCSSIAPATTSRPYSSTICSYWLPLSCAVVHHLLQFWLVVIVQSYRLLPLALAALKFHYPSYSSATTGYCLPPFA